MTQVSRKKKDATCWSIPMTERDEKKVREENKKIRYLRILVDLHLGLIMSGDVSLEDAQRMITRLREISEELFPGKGYVFDLVYLPRFRRAIKGAFNRVIQ